MSQEFGVRSLESGVGVFIIRFSLLGLEFGFSVIRLEF